MIKKPQLKNAAILEEQFVVDMQREDNPQCPKCTSSLDITQVVAMIGGDNVVVSCKAGHDFETYFRMPKLYMYDVTDGIGTPFDTSP